MKSRIISETNTIPWWRTEINKKEREAVNSAILEEHLSQGPVTETLERSLCEKLNVGHAIMTNSGSIALYMVCIANNIGYGDEVIVPANTFIATAHGAYLNGAKIILADCCEESPIIDHEEISRKVTARTKAIFVVHLNGRSCEMDKIKQLADKRNILVIEDAAQAIFSKSPTGLYLGTESLVGTYSFGMVKLLSFGQGGAIVTNDDRLAERLRKIRNHGSEVTHDYSIAGCNFKYNDILASIGVEQLERYNDRVQHSIKIYKSYEEALDQVDFIKLVPVNIENGEVPLWVEVVSEDREKLIEYLNQNGVQTRLFLPSLSSAPHFATGEIYPNTQKFASMGFILPCGPAQPLSNVSKSIEILLNYRK